MIIYNRKWLANLGFRAQTDAAFNQGIIHQTERKAIYEKYQIGFYTPNTFVRIGLFVLTLIILSCAFALIALAAIDSKGSWGGLLVVLSLICYGGSEFMAREKNHYRSGVDDALVWVSAALMLGAFLVFNDNEPGYLMVALFCFPISIFLVLRFADSLMAVVAFLSLMVIVFFTWINLTGYFGVATMPFLMMGCTAVVYFVINKCRKWTLAQCYHNCIDVIEVLALITFYASGNYLVVRELGGDMMGIDANDNKGMPLAWLFWAFTVLIPFAYLYFGIKTKSRVLIRTCMLLFICAIGTFRYYHSIMPMERALILAGAVLLAIAFMITRYLKTPRNGFTTTELESNELMDKLQLESLIATEIIPQQTSAPEKGFGGGDFGGGGSSSSY